MLTGWLQRLVAMFRHRRLDAELDEEIQTHIEMATEGYVRQGMSLEDAQRAARRSFGGVEQVRERHREARGVPWLEELGRDLRLATRTLLKERGFTLTVVVTLAVAIGANAAIVAVVDAVLLRPLPYPEAERVVTLGRVIEDGRRVPSRFSLAAYRFVREENQSFNEIGAHATGAAPLTGDGEPMWASVAGMTNTVFAVMGVSPQIGRLPTPEEDLPSGPRVAVLSHDLWVARFGSDPSVVGRTIELNDTIREVVGVMPWQFGFPSRDVDVWVPMQLDLAGSDLASRLFLAGRLGPGATARSATADIARLTQRLPEIGHPALLLSTILAGETSVLPLKEERVGDSRSLLLVVLGAVSLVLLVACSNVATLFIVRAEGRTQQRAVRAALGASRRRLVQHALSEALLLAFAGGAGGLLLASAGARVLVRLAPASIPGLEGVAISGLVLAYAATVSLMAAVAFAAVPLVATRYPSRLGPALAAAGRNATAPRQRVRLRSVLVTVEVALAVVLLIGSGLMARSYAKLRSVELGFDPTNLITFGLILPGTRYAALEAEQLYERVVERLGELPDVESVAVTTGLPVTPVQAAYRLDIEDFPDGSDQFVIRWVTAGYFETMQIPVLAGRTIMTEDVGEFRFFISESFAEMYWTTTSAIGKRVGPGTWFEVTGVVGDESMRGLDLPVEASVYVPIGSPLAPPGSLRNVTVVVRAPLGVGLAPILRSEIASLDPELPLIDVRTMDEVISGSYAVSRASFAMLLLVISAVVALVLGVVGVYGVIAYVVSGKTSEIGIRIALGATPRDIGSTVVGSGMLPGLLGVALGVGTGVVGSRTIASLLFETDVLDTPAFVLGPLVFLVVTAAACVVPARRAIRVDPVSALRRE